MKQSDIDQIVSALKPIFATKDDLKGLAKQADLEAVRQDVNGLKQDMTTVKQDVSTLKQDVSTLKQDVSTLKQDVSTLKQDVTEIKDLVKVAIPAILEDVDEIHQVVVKGKLAERVSRLEVKRHTSQGLNP